MGVWLLIALGPALAAAGGSLAIGDRRLSAWISAAAVIGSRERHVVGDVPRHADLSPARHLSGPFPRSLRIRHVDTIGDQRFPERLSMMRAEPRIFDPGWLYRPITTAFLRVAQLVRNIQAGPLGLYLLYLLAVFVALLLIAPRLG